MEDSKSTTHAYDRSTRIRELNDQLRVSREGGRFLITPGVTALGHGALIAIFDTLTRFDAFHPSNDPYGEHDMGAIEFAGQTLLWKIDYYDEALEFGSQDPADPNVTSRVLTIMLASEY